MGPSGTLARLLDLPRRLRRPRLPGPDTAGRGSGRKGAAKGRDIRPHDLGASGLDTGRPAPVVGVNGAAPQSGNDADLRGLNASEWQALEERVAQAVAEPPARPDQPAIPQPPTPEPSPPEPHTPPAPAAPAFEAQPAPPAAPVAPQIVPHATPVAPAVSVADIDPRQAPAPDLQAGSLEVHSIFKSFKSRPVVKGVSLGVRRGEVVGLLGPNGAGKTTVFYMITGLISADSGSITFDDNDITRLPMYRRARLGIGYLPQEPSIFRGMTVEQNIRSVLEIAEPNRKKRAEKLESLLEEFTITRLRKSPAIALSGGERRRVEIARALASGPAFMLLDEPFAGIDPIAVGDIRALVRHLSARGIGVLITDHNVRETLGLIDRAYIIHDGQVLMQGSPDEVVANEDVRRFYLGDEFRM